MSVKNMDSKSKKRQKNSNSGKFNKHHVSVQVLAQRQAGLRATEQTCRARMPSAAHAMNKDNEAPIATMAIKKVASPPERGSPLREISPSGQVRVIAPTAPTLDECRNSPANTPRNGNPAPHD